MADLNLPGSVGITDLQLNPYEPGLNRYVSQFTGKQSFAYSSPGQWRGTVTLAALDTTDSDNNAAAGVINAFIASMRDGGKSLRLPLDGVPTLARGFVRPNLVPKVSEIDADGDLTFDKAHTIKAGEYFGMGSATEKRLYIALVVGTSAQGVTQPDKLTPWPIFSAVVGNEIGRATSIDVRLTDNNTLAVPRTPNLMGPWTFSWVEDN